MFYSFNYTTPISISWLVDLLISEWFSHPLQGAGCFGSGKLATSAEQRKLSRRRRTCARAPVRVSTSSMLLALSYMPCGSCSPHKWDPKSLRRKTKRTANILHCDSIQLRRHPARDASHRLAQLSAAPALWSCTVSSHDFKSRVSNPRSTAYFHVKMPLERSDLQPSTAAGCSARS